MVDPAESDGTETEVSIVEVRGSVKLVVASVPLIGTLVSTPVDSMVVLPSEEE